MPTKNNPARAVRRSARRHSEHPLCAECRRPIEGPRFAFAGFLACEECVRAYFATADPKELGLEMRSRLCSAREPAASPAPPPPSAPWRAAICCSCLLPITGTPFSYGGGLACEACIRRQLTNYPTAELAEELLARFRSACKILEGHVNMWRPEYRR